MISSGKINNKFIKMDREKIIKILVDNSLSWNKTEIQDRAEIYVDDFIKELLEAINYTKCWQ